MDQRVQALYAEYGQSLWLDEIDRDLLAAGGLASLVETGLRGVTTNPTIFHRAVAGRDSYDDSIRELIQADHEIDGAGLYHWLVLQDVQWAADVLRPVFESSGGTDGFVSVEVPPFLAHQPGATEESARHLWRQIDRPNLMIKVPGTRDGLDAVERLIGEGINVNVTLLFSVNRYKEVSEAYLRGLARNPEPDRVSSVASFFVSRIDARVDPMLDALDDERAGQLRGRTAMNLAKLAYRHYRSRFSSPAFEEQRQRGARPQRLLWASTGNKDPDARDTRYLEGLIGPETVTTVPLATLEAFLHHGEIGPTLERDMQRAERELQLLRELGIDLEFVASELESDGIQKFRDSYDALLELLERKRADVARSFAVR